MREKFSLEGEKIERSLNRSNEVLRRFRAFFSPPVHCTSFDAKNSVFVDARLTLRLLPGVKQKMGWLPEGEKHKSRSTEFDARIFPFIQGHFVMPGGHYFANVKVLIPMFKPISVHFDVIATRKEYSWIWKGKMNLCLIYSFLTLMTYISKCWSQKLVSKLTEARWSLFHKTTNFKTFNS